MQRTLFSIYAHTMYAYPPLSPQPVPSTSWRTLGTILATTTTTFTPEWWTSRSAWAVAIMGSSCPTKLPCENAGAILNHRGRSRCRTPGGPRGLSSVDLVSNNFNFHLVHQQLKSVKSKSEESRKKASNQWKPRCAKPFSTSLQSLSMSWSGSTTPCPRPR